MLKRREFLQTGMLGTGAAVTLGACGGQEDKLIPLLIPEDRILPGQDRWTASTCHLCDAGCGLLVRSMMGEAEVEHDGHKARQMILQVKKVEGHPEHPVNQGRLCARGQAAPQMLYNPDRIRTPLRRTGPRGSGEFEPISWDDAFELLVDNVAPLSREGEGDVAAIVGFSTAARLHFIRTVLGVLGSERCYVQYPLGVEVLREANRRIFGRPFLEHHDLANARYLLSFGANFVETHTSPVHYNLGLGDFRKGRPGIRGKFVHVGSRFSVTAANADEWLPARPGTEAEVALGIAHVIVREGLQPESFQASRVRGFEAFRDLVLERYGPDQVSSRCDLAADTIVRIAREFARHHPAVTLAGGAAVGHPNGVFAAAAVQALNVLMGNADRVGGVSWRNHGPGATGRREEPRQFWFDDFQQSADSIRALVLFQANPLYDLPPSLGLAAAIDKIPFVAAFDTSLNDSATHADLVLPDQTFLERWDLSETEAGVDRNVVSITQPIVRPLYESRDSADVLLKLVQPIAGEGTEPIPFASYESYQSYLSSRANELDVFEKGSFSSESPGDFLRQLTEEGVWVERTPRRAPVTEDLRYIVEADSPRVRDVPPEEGLYLQPFRSVALGDGSSANLPWMQELPDPMTSVVWGSWLEVNPRTARALAIGESELVWVESANGRIQVPVLFHPAVRPDTVCMPFGQGHKHFGRYASGRGSNPWEIIAPDRIRDTGEIAWAATRVKITGTGQRASLVKLGHDREHSSTEIHR